MLSLNSSHSQKALLSRWDERTSPARFAGNDDVLDTVYRAKRNGNKVYLIRKGYSSVDPFVTVFRGEIVQSERGSVLQGRFTKRVFDYVLILLFLVLDVAFAARSYLMGSMTYTGLAGCALFAAIMILLAIPMPSARKRYTEFLKDITRDE